MCILKRQSGLASLKACGFSLSACRVVELQPTDFMDPIFRILTTSDSRYSITPNSPWLLHVSLGAVSFMRYLFSVCSLSFFSHTVSPLFIHFPCSCSVLHSTCIPDCAVPCWASGSSLVLQRRSLIQCFISSEAGCDWFHFTLKALTRLIHSLADWNLHLKWPSCWLP